LTVLGLKKVQFSEQTFVLKSPPIVNLQNVMPHCRATEQTSTIRADIGRQKPTLRKIKRAVLPTHKPTQKHHI
jgi:hypothetical protein